MTHCSHDKGHCRQGRCCSKECTSWLKVAQDKGPHEGEELPLRRALYVYVVTQPVVPLQVHFYRPKTLELARKPKYARALPRLVAKQDAFSVLRSPLTTESAMKKIEDTNTLVFLADSRANKRQIKHAVSKQYDVKVEKVNTLIRPDGVKKAYVKLSKDSDALDVANRIGII
jgi:large subunit ribosomal protein L23Ae